MTVTYVCSWCGVEVEPNYDHVEPNPNTQTTLDRSYSNHIEGAHAMNCKGTFSHPGSGSCRRRFTDLGHHQVSEHHKAYDTIR